MSEPIAEIARAKINLALHVLGRRTDGYHELDSIVAFADYGDLLTLEASGVTRLDVTGPFAKDVPTDTENLVLRAYALLSAHVDCPPVAFALEKNLPVASGIGGGSADAAAALRGLIRLSGKNIAPSVVNDIALTLGADVPVCFNGQAVRMQGVGETLTQLERPPEGAIVLVNPLVPCGTSSVFRTLGLQNGENFQTALDPDDPSQWRNDLMSSAIAIVPEIARVLAALQSDQDLKTVRMSGSGATCFGLADDIASAAQAARRIQIQFPDWWVVSAALGETTAWSSSL
jgi:4-diphosphocytidyl-2-C-methyl-D-erythritol kinase